MQYILRLRVSESLGLNDIKSDVCGTEKWWLAHQQVPFLMWCWSGVSTRRGRSGTDLLATLQELEHLGVVSLTEALDLTTAVGRAMAGLLAVFAAFEREVLQERTKAGLAHAPGEREAAGPAGNRGRA